MSARMPTYVSQLKVRLPKPRFTQTFTPTLISIDKSAQKICFPLHLITEFKLCLLQFKNMTTLLEQTKINFLVQTSTEEAFSFQFSRNFLIESVFFSFFREFVMAKAWWKQLGSRHTCRRDKTLILNCKDETFSEVWIKYQQTLNFNKLAD